MSSRNQPYFPLYIQDFMTDEKLMECSASATGIFVRIMCIMHKSDEYGKILLKQKDKQKSSNELNFAYKLAKFMPYQIDEVENAIKELVENNVLIIEGDYMIQKRMVKDNKISELRSNAGKKGGIKSVKNRIDFAQAKTQANSENENENEDENENLWIKVKAKFENDFRFEEQFCRTKNISLIQFQQMRKEFLDDIELRQEYKPLKELKNHFTNWSNKKITINAKSELSSKSQQEYSNMQKYLDRYR